MFLIYLIYSSAEFVSYFEHVKSLRFEDRPDYDYLKRLFRELFFRKGFSYDNMFDWELSALKTADDAEAGAVDGAGVVDAGMTADADMYGN